MKLYLNTLACKMAPQVASSSSSHLNALGWWRGCAAPYQPQLRLWLLERPSAATTAPASVRAGASRCGQIQTKSPQIPLEEFPFASEPSQLGSPWSTSTWVYRAHQACPVLAQCQGSPRKELGLLGVPCTASRSVGAGAASQHDQVLDQAARAVNSHLQCFLSCPW